MDDFEFDDFDLEKELNEFERVKLPCTYNKTPGVLDVRPVPTGYTETDSAGHSELKMPNLGFETGYQTTEAAYIQTKQNTQPSLPGPVGKLPAVDDEKKRRLIKMRKKAVLTDIQKYLGLEFHHLPERNSINHQTDVLIQDPLKNINNNDFKFSDMNKIHSCATITTVCVIKELSVDGDDISLLLTDGTNDIECYVHPIVFTSLSNHLKSGNTIMLNKATTFNTGKGLPSLLVCSSNEVLLHPVETDLTPTCSMEELDQTLSVNVYPEILSAEQCGNDDEQALLLEGLKCLDQEFDDFF